MHKIATKKSGDISGELWYNGRDIFTETLNCYIVGML